MDAAGTRRQGWRQPTRCLAARGRAPRRLTAANASAHGSATRSDDQPGRPMARRRTCASLGRGPRRHSERTQDHAGTGGLGGGTGGHVQLVRRPGKLRPACAPPVDGHAAGRRDQDRRCGRSGSAATARREASPCSRNRARHGMAASRRSGVPGNCEWNNCPPPDRAARRALRSIRAARTRGAGMAESACGVVCCGPPAVS